MSSEGAMSASRTAAMSSSSEVIFGKDGLSILYVIVDSFFHQVFPAGFEPATSAFVAPRSKSAELREHIFASNSITILMRIAFVL